MSKILNEMLISRASKHARTGFSYVLDFETGDVEAITLALIEAASIPQALVKLGLNVPYPAGGQLTAAKVQSFQKGLENAFQKTSFVEGYKADLPQFGADLWGYFEATCLALENVETQS